MKISELKSLPQNELKNLLLEKRDTLRQFYFKLARGRVKNLKEAREMAKDGIKCYLEALLKDKMLEMIGGGAKRERVTVNV